jgi:hypothetical protein
MVNKIMLIVASILLVSCGITDTIIVKQVNPDQMVHYSNIYSFDDIQLDDNSYVLYFSAGDKIPLQIVLNNDFVEVDTNNNINLIAKRNIYFMIKDPEVQAKTSDYKITRNSKIYISFDAVRWSSIHNSDALKEIAGFDEEKVTFGFEATNHDGIRSNLTIDNK